MYHIRWLSLDIEGSGADSLCIKSTSNNVMRYMRKYKVTFSRYFFLLSVLGYRAEPRQSCQCMLP